MTLKISHTEFKHFFKDLQSKKEGDYLKLDSRTLSLLLSLMATLEVTVELLQKGSGVHAIRKLLRVFPTKNPGKQGKDTTGSSSCQQGGREQSKQNSTPPNEKDSGPEKTTDSSCKESRPEDSKDMPNQGEKPTKTNPNHSGMAGCEDYPHAPVVEHNVDGLSPKDRCPECLTGKLYVKPRQTLQFVGGPLVTPEIHKFNDLVCNLCGQVFRSELSQDFIHKGVCQNGKHTYSSIVMIALLKFFLCLPLYRSEHKGAWLGVKLARSTQHDQIGKLVVALEPLARYLTRAAADAQKFHADDTTGIILTKPYELKVSRGKTVPELRDGRHSSVVVAYLKEDRPVVQVKTDIIHAGEFMDAILNHRTSPSKPMIMWDRLSSNKVTVRDYIDMACLQHARNNFYKLKDDDPTFVRSILDLFGEIFAHDVKANRKSPKERLKYHKEHSCAPFQEILDNCKQAIEKKNYLPNSKLGQACEYMVKHQKPLRAFLDYEDAPLSNNVCERTIANIVLLRNVIHHFKNEQGAKFADILWSVGFTAYYNHLNLFEYFQLILANQAKVQENPEEWSPLTIAKRYPHLILPQDQRFDSKRPAKQKTL